MSEAALQDRVLELALHRAFGAIEVEDLSERLVGALREHVAAGTAGRRRRRVRTSESGGGSRARREPDSLQRPRGPRFWLVAASILVPLGLIFAMQWIAGVPRPIATASMDVTILRGDDLARLMSRDVRRGDHVIGSGDASGDWLELRITNGDRLVFSPTAILAFDSLPESATRSGESEPLGLTLLSGSLEVVVASDGPVADARVIFFRTPAGVVATASPGARLRIEAWPENPPTKSQKPPFEETARTMIRNPITTVVTFTILAGSAELSASDWQQKLSSGDVVVVDGDEKPKPEPKLTARAKEQLDRSVRTLIEAKPDEQISAPQRVEQMKRMIDAASAITTVIDHFPAGMDDVRSALGDLPLTGDPVSTRRGCVLTILVMDRDEKTTGRLLGLLGKEPTAFSAEQLLHLAQRGLAPAIAALEEQIRKNQHEQRFVLAAAWLAMDGKGVGRKMLVDHAAEATSRGLTNSKALAAAAGLYRLGDRMPWLKMREMYKLRIERALETKDEAKVMMAGLQVVEFDYFQRAVRTKRPVPVPTMVDPVRDYAQKHLARLRNIEYVRELLSRIFRRIRRR